MRDRAAGVVLLATAAVYAALVGAAGVTSNATPFLLGLGAVAAGVVARQTGLIGVGLTLVGWGTAVLAVWEGPLPDNRAAAAFLVGVGAGLLAAYVVAVRRRDTLSIGPVMTVLLGGLAFYIAFDIEAVGGWPFWAIAVAIWGAVELVRPAVDRDR